MYGYQTPLRWFLHQPEMPVGEFGTIGHRWVTGSHRGVPHGDSGWDWAVNGPRVIVGAVGR